MKLAIRREEGETINRNEYMKRAIEAYNEGKIGAEPHGRKKIREPIRP